MLSSRQQRVISVAVFLLFPKFHFTSTPPQVFHWYNNTVTQVTVQSQAQMLLILHLSLVSSVTCAALFWSLCGVSRLSFKKVYSLRLWERPLPYWTNSSQYICSKHHAHVITFISLRLYICDYVTTVSPTNLTISSIRARSMSVSFIKPKAFSTQCSLFAEWVIGWRNMTVLAWIYIYYLEIKQLRQHFKG